MNTKELENLIINAPEGATHYSWETYCKANKDFFYDWNGEEWCAYFVPDGDMRSLADIKALVAKDKRIAELEKEKQVLIKQHDMWKQQWHELNDSLAIRALEQRINALQSHVSSCAVMEIEPSTRTLNSRIEMLREQAKQLKERG